MSSILPIESQAFINTFSKTSRYQLGCLLNTVTNKQLKILVEVIFNLLYNKDIKFTTQSKNKLKKFATFYEEFITKKIPLKQKKLMVAENIDAIKSALVAVSNI